MSEITEEPGAPGPICKIGTLSSVSPDPGVRHSSDAASRREGWREREKEKEKKRKEEGKKEHREVERWGTQPGEEDWATRVPGPGLAGVGVTALWERSKVNMKPADAEREQLGRCKGL